MAPQRCKEHLAFIRSLPCCVCGHTRGVEAAHTSGSRGMGQKRSDLETIPLCPPHHQEQHRIGWPRFILTYELDVVEILTELRERPRIVIVPGGTWMPVGIKDDRQTKESRMRYVASYRGQEFTVGVVAEGLCCALSRAFRVCGEYLREEMLRRVAA